MGFMKTYNILNRWTILFFRIRWITGAIGAVLMIGWLALGGLPEHVGTDRAEAVLVDVEGDKGARYGHVQLDDGQLVRVYLQEPVPAPGSRLPILIEHYDDGSQAYQMDGEKWMDRL